MNNCLKLVVSNRRFQCDAYCPGLPDRRVCFHDEFRRITGTWRARDESDANDPEETFIDASAVAIRARRVDVRLASGAP